MTLTHFNRAYHNLPRIHNRLRIYKTGQGTWSKEDIELLRKHRFEYKQSLKEIQKLFPNKSLATLQQRIYTTIHRNEKILKKRGITIRYKVQDPCSSRLLEDQILYGRNLKEGIVFFDVDELLHLYQMFTEVIGKSPKVFLDSYCPYPLYCGTLTNLLRKVRNDQYLIKHKYFSQTDPKKGSKRKVKAQSLSTAISTVLNHIKPPNLASPAGSLQADQPLPDRSSLLEKKKKRIMWTFQDDFNLLKAMCLHQGNIHQIHKHFFPNRKKLSLYQRLDDTIAIHLKQAKFWTQEEDQKLFFYIENHGIHSFLTKYQILRPYSMMMNRYQVLHRLQVPFHQYTKEENQLIEEFIQTNLPHLLRHHWTTILDFLPPDFKLKFSTHNMELLAKRIKYLVLFHEEQRFPEWDDVSDPLLLIDLVKNQNHQIHLGSLSKKMNRSPYILHQKYIEFLYRQVCHWIHQQRSSAKLKEHYYQYVLKPPSFTKFQIYQTLSAQRKLDTLQDLEGFPSDSLDDFSLPSSLSIKSKE